MWPNRKIHAKTQMKTTGTVPTRANTEQTNRGRDVMAQMKMQMQNDLRCEFFCVTIFVFELFPTSFEK